VLDLNWEPSPLIAVNGPRGDDRFMAAIGVLASMDALRHKPLATVRAD